MTPKQNNLKSEKDGKEIKKHALNPLLGSPESAVPKALLVLSLYASLSSGKTWLHSGQDSRGPYLPGDPKNISSLQASSSLTQVERGLRLPFPTIPQGSCSLLAPPGGPSSSLQPIPEVPWRILLKQGGKDPVGKTSQSKRR